MVASARDLQRVAHLDSDDVARRGETQLSEARQDHIPGLMLLQRLLGVFGVGAQAFACVQAADCAGGAFIPAGLTVSGPSAWLEMPVAESPDPFFAALSNT